MVKYTFVSTVVYIKFEWDEKKRAANLEKHGLDFVAACHSPMLIVEDNRLGYGEQRWVGMGLLGDRVMLVVFAKRLSNTIRIISFRKANKREVSYYEKAIS